MAESTIDPRYLEIFPAWLRALGEDAVALSEIVGAHAQEPACRHVVAGLNYVFRSLDLIADGIDDLGLLDDAFILRVTSGLAMNPGEEAAGLAHPVIERLASEVEHVQAFLGDEYPKLEAYARTLERGAARGRTVDEIVGDEAVRRSFVHEVKAWSADYQVPSFHRDMKTLIKLRAFLGAKLA